MVEAEPRVRHGLPVGADRQRLPESRAKEGVTFETSSAPRCWRRVANEETESGRAGLFDRRLGHLFAAVASVSMVSASFMRSRVSSILAPASARQLALISSRLAMTPSVSNSSVLDQLRPLARTACLWSSRPFPGFRCMSCRRDSLLRDSVADRPLRLAGALLSGAGRWRRHVWAAPRGRTLKECKMLPIRAKLASRPTFSTHLNTSAAP